jgi:hypothetical protein
MFDVSCAYGCIQILEVSVSLHTRLYSFIIGQLSSFVHGLNLFPTPMSRV